MIEHEFNEDYFEHGLAKGISLYENYHWMPERSFREAHWFIQHMHMQSGECMVDFGCAKGFFVKAMRLLGYCAYGTDTSRYALEHSDAEVRQFLMPATHAKYDCGLCKDVLEHSVNEEALLSTLKAMAKLTDAWLLIVPIANQGKYINPFYEKDVTHRIRFTEQQWLEAIVCAGLQVAWREYQLTGFKEKWAMHKGDIFLATTT